MTFKLAVSSDLATTTNTVFEECADVYLHEDKHWGCDLDIMKRHIEAFPAPEILDLGVGHAWHLANLHLVSSARIKRAVGVDYSGEMLARARALLGGMLHQGQPLLEKIELRQSDFFNIDFADEAFDVGLLLNNTLGNLPGKSFDDAHRQRRNILRRLYRTLRHGGCLIVSVNNADKLTEEDKYGNVFELDHDLSNLSTMDLVVRLKKTQTPYYSHWFTANEVRQLLYEAGFRIQQLEERESRFVVVGQKTGRGA
jgi:SAM-dependent methyltransferase